MAEVSVEELKALVGRPIGTSEWLPIDQATIDRFADATGDHQFIHVDPEAARATPFGGTIAHGFLTLSLLSQMIERSDMPRIAGMWMGVNYGANRLRFLSPVPSGARVRGRFTLLAVEEERAGQIQQTVEAIVEIEGQDRPALVAEWISQIFL